MQDSKKIFSQILKELNEKELKAFITKYCKTNTTMQNKFLTHFAHKITSKPEEKFETIIYNSIKACTDARGHFLINPKKTNSALKPLYKLLKQEKVTYHQKPYESFLLAKLILEHFGQYYEDFYEVNDFHKLDDLFYEAIELIDAVCQSTATPNDFKEEIFEDLLTLAQEPYFDKSTSYDDSGIDSSLLHIASTLCSSEDQITQFLEILDRKIAKKEEYSKQKFLNLKIAFLKAQKLDDALSQLIEENMDNQEIRDMVIETALKNGEVQKTIHLIQEGITLFTQKRLYGIVSNYHHKLLEIYKKHQMDDAYLKLLSTLYREGYNQKYYDLLKKCYTKEAWKQEVAQIIEEIQQKSKKEHFHNSYSSTLADIYVKEGMTEALFQLIQNNKNFYFLETYGKYCKDAYASEILQIYAPLIDKELHFISTRKEYAELAGMLKRIAITYEGGKPFVATIYQTIKRRYANKPALQEEMSILQHLETQENRKQVSEKVEKREQKTLF